MWWGRHCHLGHRGGNRPGKFQELSPSLPDGRQLIWIQWWIWNGPHQVSLTSQAMPRFAQCWGVLRKAALTACAPEELLEIPLISTGKSAQAGPLSSLVQRSLGWEVASASAWEAPASAGILLTLGSSIFTHPLVSQRKKRQNILAEQANGSQMTEVKKKKKVKKFCNMLLFKSKKKLPTSLFWVFLSLFELSVLWNILLSTFSFITVEKVRQTGHAKSLNKFIVFLFQTSCRSSPLKPGQEIKEKVAWAAESGRQEKPRETRTWGLVQDRVNSGDRE